MVPHPAGLFSMDKDDTVAFFIKFFSRRDDGRHFLHRALAATEARKF